MKKFQKVLIANLCVLMACTNLVACGGPKKDNTKTYLYVYNFDGGIRTDWLYEAADRFEALYADVSFEEGKMGVVVEVAPGKASLDGIASMPQSVFFTEQVNYNDLIAQNLLLDIKTSLYIAIHYQLLVLLQLLLICLNNRVLNFFFLLFYALS